MSRHLMLLLCGVFATVIGWLHLSTLTADDTPAAKAAPAESGAGFKLAYKYQSGESVRYETTQSVRFVSEFKGIDEVATNRTETRKRYQVSKVHPDGSAELELIMEWVRMKVKTGTDDPGIEFDSKSPDAKEQPKFRNVYKIIGKPQATLLCAPSGKVKKIVMKKSTGEANSTPQVQLKDVAGADDFNFLTVFPESPLKIGETWSEKSEVKVTVEDNKLQQSVDLKRTYKLESVEGSLATISFKTAILTPINNPSIKIQLIQRETKGKLVFDMDRGAVVTRTVETDKSLINPIGDNTAMHSTSHLLERMITETAEISDVPDEGVKKQ